MNDLQQTEWNVLLNLQTNNPVYHDEPSDLGPIEPSVLHGDDDKQYPVEFDAVTFKAICRDEYTRDVLPNHLVRAAIAEDMAYFNNAVWQAAGQPQATDT